MTTTGTRLGQLPIRVQRSSCLPSCTTLPLQELIDTPRLPLRLAEPSPIFNDKIPDSTPNLRISTPTLAKMPQHWVSSTISQTTREQFAATLDAALASRPVFADHPFKVEDLHDLDPHPVLLQWPSEIPHHQAPVSPPTPPVLPVPASRPLDLDKPINALGHMCFAGFYLVSLTRTIVRNKTVPIAVRRAFMAPQLAFEFTVKDPRDSKSRHVPTVQIPYQRLCAAGEWLRAKLALPDGCPFKSVKDALQKSVTEAWGEGHWHLLVDTLSGGFDSVSPLDIDAALACDGVSGRAKGTPIDYFRQINCHKGAPDIRRDVDGAISAREALRWVLGHLGLNASGCNISVATFRDDVFPLWKMRCPYVRDHQDENCCHFYDGGYFKKIMIHKHLYNVDCCSSSYHVKDLFEGLDEVIKVWSNPTGMCVREAKCAAGLRYNVDKSFQSGIRSYSKAKFLEAAPHAARDLLDLERQLHQRVQAMLNIKQKRHPKCRKALRAIEIRSECFSQRQLPDVLRAESVEILGGSSPASPARKRKRQDRDALLSPSTPREQKRKHAHLSLKRKEAAEKRVKQYLELLREDCQKMQAYLDAVSAHGDDCNCLEPNPADAAASRWLTSANVPVA